MAPGMAEPFEPCRWEGVAAFVRGLEAGAGPLETRIHPADEMYGFEVESRHRTREAAALLYFATGSQIVHAVDQVLRWRFPDRARVRSLLDFGSGYGRATRFLTRLLPAERITVAEIDPNAVAFQQDTFGVRGVVSGTQPGDLRVERIFDAILAVSFFSHLPAARFEAWLARLYALAAPGGVVVFSVHGMGLLSGPEPEAAQGIVFRAVSETTRLEGADYGTSFVTPTFVEAVARDVTGGEARLIGCPFGLAGYQDLYVLARPPLPEAPDLRLARFPLGALDAAQVREGSVLAEGWACGSEDERPPDVRLVLDGAVAAVSPGEGAPGSRRRWKFTFPTAAVSPDAIIRVEAESSRGLSRILVAETLRPYL
ncbi:MAG TPA: class I SAM-dependent methyltransferase [Thermoanaerobaculia bacterium]